MKKLIWTAGILLLAGTALGAAPATELKLMSYNIRYIDAPGDEGEFAWEARRESSITMIRRESRSSTISLNGYPSTATWRWDVTTASNPMAENI